MTWIYEHRGSASTRYTAVSRTPLAEGQERYASAHVDLEHEAEHPSFSGHNISRRAEEGSGHPTELFQHQPGTIIGAFSHPTMSAHIPTLLGMAADRNQRDTGGRMPLPDSSLSATSSPMVQKLRAKGAQFPVNPDNPHARVTNKISAQDRHMNFATPWDPSIASGTLVPAEQVQSGRQLMRQQLRGSKVNPNEFGNETPTTAPSDGYKSSWQDDVTKPRQMALFSGRDLLQAQHGMGPIANGRK